MDERGACGRRWPAACLVVCLAAWVAAALGAAPASAEPEAPEPPKPVQRLLESRYLSEDERKDIRVRHGVWTDADLDTPARRARAALIAGDLHHESLSDASADALDRADGMVQRGEFQPALDLIAASSEAASRRPMRASRLRAEALWWLGRREELVRALDATAAVLASQRLSNADELVEGVRVLALRARVLGPSKPGSGGDYQAMVSMLARARTELDRACWPARLAEAELLFDKDNGAEASKAAAEVLELCPRNAAVRRLLGEIAGGNFNPEGAERAAEELRRNIGRDGAVSADAAMVMSASRLRHNDPEGALAHLEPALAAYPSMPALRARRAAIAAAMFDEAGAAEMAAAFDAAHPLSALAHFEMGSTLSQMRQYDAGAAALERAAAIEPNWAYPATELGLLEIQAGRDDRAKAALLRATALDPFNVRASNSLKLVNDLAAFATIETAHFVIRYKPGIDEVLAREMPEVLEEAHARVTGAERGGIDHVPARKTLIELMPDHRWFAVRIAGMPRVHTIAAATGPVIAMEAPRVGPHHSIGVYDWPRVVRHEYVHTVTLSRTRNRLPHWFTEAAAQHLEDGTRDFRAAQLLYDAFTNGALLDFERINTAFTRSRERPLAYAQGHWMYEFIVETWGPRAPLELMDQYAAGKREPEAFGSVLGVTREAFTARFEAWARAQLRSWGLLPAEGVPTVRELLKAEAGATEEPPEPTAEMVEKWLTAHPGHPQALKLKLAFALEASGGKATEEMEGLLREVASARPIDPEPHTLLTSLYLERLKAADASSEAELTARLIEHLEYLDAREQYSPGYAAELANRYARLGDWDRAWAKALRAVRIAPYDARQRELAATVAIKRRDLTAAERQLRALMMIEPDREIHARRLEALRKLAAP